MSDEEYQVLVDFTITNSYSTIGLLDSLIDRGHDLYDFKIKIILIRHQCGDLKKLIRG